MSRKTDHNAKFNGYRQIASSAARAKISDIIDELVRDGERVVISRAGIPIAFIAPLGDLYELDAIDAADNRVADEVLAEHKLDLVREKSIAKMVRSEVARILPPGAIRHLEKPARYAMAAGPLQKKIAVKAAAQKKLVVKGPKRAKGKREKVIGRR